MNSPIEHSAIAEQLFADRLPLASQYVELLRTDGIVQGLIGPREGIRLWDRHLFNCAVLTELIPAGVSVIDVGSGAGLPGLVLAIRRPDLTVHLVESMQRRVGFLNECVKILGLDNVTVRRSRAEELQGKLTAEFVTARAVAPLSRLIGWSWPLVGRGGVLAAMKGSNAATELAAAQPLLSQRGLVAQLVSCGTTILADPVSVVTIASKGQH